MCEFEIPRLLFYTNIPTLIAGIILGILIIKKNYKSSVNRNLFIFVILFCFWIINNILQWTIFDINVNLFLARFAILEAFSLLFFLYFTYAFIEIKLSLRQKFLIALPFTPLLIFMFTDYNLFLVDAATCSFQPGLLYIYLYSIGCMYLLWSVIILRKYYKTQTTLSEKRNQTKIVIGAIIFFTVYFLVLIALMQSLVALHYSWGEKVNLFIPFGIVIFIGMVAFAILRYKFLDIRLFIQRNSMTICIYIFLLICISVIGVIFLKNTKSILIPIVLFSVFLFSIPYLKKKIEITIVSLFPVKVVDVSTFFDRTIYKLSTDSTEEFASKLKNYIKNNVKIGSKVFIKDQDRGYWFELKNGKKDKIAWKKVIDNELQTDKTIIDVTGFHERKFEKNNITVLVPMKFHGTLFGIIALCDMKEIELSHDDRELMEELGRRSAQVVHDLRDLEKAKAGARILANRLQ